MKRLSIILFVLIFVNIFIWFFFIPDREEKLNKALSEYKIVRERKAKERLVNFQDIYLTKDKIGEYEKRLRNKEDFTKVINYVFEKSFAGKLEIKTINYVFEEKKELNLTKLTLNITLEGKYEGIKRFIYELESGSHFIIIDSVKLQKNNDIINGNMVLVTYLKGIIR